MTEDKMIGRHHQLNSLEFEQTPGDSEGQGNLECCSPWGHKKSDMTEQLNTTTTTIYKIDSKMDVRPETKKLLEENRQNTLKHKL